MPRKIYDFPEAEPDDETEQNEYLEMGVKPAICNDCDFYFDLGDQETVQKAAEQHMMKTGHVVVME